MKRVVICSVIMAAVICVSIAICLYIDRETGYVISDIGSLSASYAAGDYGAGRGFASAAESRWKRLAKLRLFVADKDNVSGISSVITKLNRVSQEDEPGEIFPELEAECASVISGIESLRDKQFPTLHNIL
ncbi:hypothetical protein FACS189499_05290 [Clostridia bacterium]|nr:hypothetical protein FACS189499_05290 [Clostridia bacterium]